MNSSPGFAGTLARSLKPGMLLPADRNYAPADLLTAITGDVGDRVLANLLPERRLTERRLRDAGFGATDGAGISDQYFGLAVLRPSGGTGVLTLHACQLDLLLRTGPVAT